MAEAAAVAPEAAPEVVAAAAVSARKHAGTRTQGEGLQGGQWQGLQALAFQLHTNHTLGAGVTGPSKVKAPVQQRCRSVPPAEAAASWTTDDVCSHAPT